MNTQDIIDDKVYKMVFDVTLKRPGCVLLQAALGCDSNIAHLFDVGSWLLAPTENLKVYNLTGKQLIQAVEVVNNTIK